MINQLLIKIENNKFINSRYFFIGLSLLFICLGLLLPDHLHDYKAYKLQWNHIIKGGDPYDANAYGLIYNLFAYVNVSKSISIPRALFILTYLAGSYGIWQDAKEKFPLKKNLILLILILNPLFLLHAIIFGSNDAFLTGVTAIAILFFLQKRFVLSGLLFAIGFGFKFIPIIIIPFFIINYKCINFKVAISFIIGITTTYTIGFLTWGKSIFKPFIFGVERPSKQLSIFRFIRGEVQPLSFLDISNADAYSIYFILASCILCFTLYYFLKFERTISAFLCYSFVLLTYKVGHHQFYFLLLILGVICYIKNQDFFNQYPKSLNSLIAFLIYFFICEFIYGATGSHMGRFRFIREYIGLPTFLIHLYMNSQITLDLIKNYKSVAVK